MNDFVEKVLHFDFGFVAETSTLKKSCTQVSGWFWVENGDITVTTMFATVGE